MKAVNKYKDANDKYFVYLTAKENGGWVIGETYSEDDAKAVVNNKNDYEVVGKKIRVSETDKKGVTTTYEIDWAGDSQVK